MSPYCKEEDGLYQFTLKLSDENYPNRDKELRRLADTIISRYKNVAEFNSIINCPDFNELDEMFNDCDVYVPINSLDVLETGITRTSLILGTIKRFNNTLVNKTVEVK